MFREVLHEREEEMHRKDKREKKNEVLTERIFDIVCLMASYGILFLLPHRIGVFFYLLFGLSAFLFCIGFFRLGISFEAPSGAAGEMTVLLIYAVSGVLLNAAGLYGIMQDQGSGRSIMIAMLLVIEALVLFAMAGSGCRTLERHRLSAIAFRAAAVLLILFGIAFAVWKQISVPSVMITAMLLIESICMWKLGDGSNPFNTLTPEIQAVPGLRIPIPQLQEAFAGVETQLGYPWVGKVETIRQDAIIYGPSEDGFFIYGYYLFGRFYVAGSTNPFFPGAEEAQGHAAAEVPDSSGVLLAKENLPEVYAQMFTRYAESGNAHWGTGYAGSGKEQ